MLGAFHTWIHGRAGQHQLTVETALLTAAVIVLTLLTIVILFLGVFVTPAA